MKEKGVGASPFFLPSSDAIRRPSAEAPRSGATWKSAPIPIEVPAIFRNDLLSTVSFMRLPFNRTPAYPWFVDGYTASARSDRERPVSLGVIQIRGVRRDTQSSQGEMRARDRRDPSANGLSFEDLKMMRMHLGHSQATPENVIAECLLGRVGFGTLPSPSFLRVRKNPMEAICKE